MDNLRISRRAMLKGLGTASAALALAACAAPSGATPVEDTGTAEVTTISLWGWWDVRMAIYQQAATSFMEANPDVEVVVETLPGGDELQQKVYSALAANTGPSMLKMWEVFFKMREEDLLLPFPEDIFPDEWFTENYPSVDW